MGDMQGKAAYAAIYVLVLPVALAAWARGLDTVIAPPAFHAPAAGIAAAVAGLLLMAWGTLALWAYGGGLPMSPYPPSRFVTRGPYAVVRHPLYLGAVLLCAGVALAAGSAPGLWVVTPTLAALASAWVLGFEDSLTRARLGAAGRPSPVVCLAPDDEERPSAGERLFAFTHLFLPWLVLYFAVETLGVPPDAIEAWTAWDTPWAVHPWTEVVYVAAYPLVGAVPIVLATRRDLRWFITRGWTATAMVVALWLLLPLVATAKAVPGNGLLVELMRWERAYDSPATAFPSFHVAWAVLSAAALSRRWPSLAAGWWLLASAIAVSCVTTGMHASADVVAGAVAGLLVLRADRIWGAVRAWAERVSNSWREATLGPVRFMSHSVWAAGGAWLGLVAVAALAAGHVGPAIAVTAGSIVGAALWAQVVEGSPQLLRPYGYYGAALFAVLGFVVAGALGVDAWLLAGAFAIGAAITQAIGRGRCLVQGCCHGAPAPPWLGIRVTHPRSRVTRLSSLAGVPLHPTQVYSMGWMLLVAAALLRLWSLRVPLPFICGAYFVLSGLGRFVEEHLRGEPQTLVWGGLRLYQWLAIASIVGGAIAMTIPGAPAPVASWPTGHDLLAITGFTLLVYAAYGIDFPALHARFSRLV